MWRGELAGESSIGKGCWKGVVRFSVPNEKNMDQ
jgi:hypothetical protein